MDRGSVFFVGEIKGLRVYTRKPVNTYKSEKSYKESYSELRTNNSNMNPVFCNNSGNGFLNNLVLD